MTDDTKHPRKATIADPPRTDGRTGKPKPKPKQG